MFMGPNHSEIEMDPAHLKAVLTSPDYDFPPSTWPFVISMDWLGRDLKKSAQKPLPAWKVFFITEPFHLRHRPISCSRKQRALFVVCSPDFPMTSAPERLMMWSWDF